MLITRVIDHVENARVHFRRMRTQMSYGTTIFKAVNATCLIATHAVTSGEIAQQDSAYAIVWIFRDLIPNTMPAVRLGEYLQGIFIGDCAPNGSMIEWTTKRGITYPERTGLSREILQNGESSTVRQFDSMFFVEDVSGYPYAEYDPQSSPYDFTPTAIVAMTRVAIRMPGRLLCAREIWDPFISPDVKEYYGQIDDIRTLCHQLSHQPDLFQARAVDWDPAERVL